MQEIEIKILEVDKEDLKKKFDALGAKEIQNTRLTVDWYGPKGLTHDGDDPWFLRVRTYSHTDKHEVTWKGKSEFINNSRKTKEINFTVSSPEEIGNLLEELNLEKYAHQEKDRISYKFGNIQFDLDTYPKMPPYLEIEATSEKEISEIMEKLELNNHKTWNDGERSLIKGKYNLNWFEMYF